ncbi:hypothetical protein QFZ66_004794 [Streptomyces sp. B4I13]|nr:transposase [Streptomyces sp. B4I13]MDQ0960916.1 hypothetical protein [Streptomyces sp. B4I13]
MEDASTTSDNVTEVEPGEPSEAASAKSVDDRLIDELVGRAQAEGLQLTGEGGLLQQLTKRLLESALEGEITDHLGYDKHDPAGKNGGNSRNGTRAKTVLTDVGPVEIAVPRDREGSFEGPTYRLRPRVQPRLDEPSRPVASQPRPSQTGAKARGDGHGITSVHLDHAYRQGLILDDET